MTHEEKAREILQGFLCDGGVIDHTNLKTIGRQLWKRIASELASAEKKGNELHTKERDTVFALGLQQGWNEAITAAVRVALSHSAVGGGCPLSDESVRSYNEAVSQIATKIEALRKG